MRGDEVRDLQMELPALRAPEAPQEEDNRLPVVADYGPPPGVISGEKVSAVRAIGGKSSLYPVDLCFGVLLDEIVIGDNHKNTSFRLA